MKKRHYAIALVAGFVTSFIPSFVRAGRKKHQKREEFLQFLEKEMNASWFDTKKMMEDRAFKNRTFYKDYNGDLHT